MIVLVIVVVTMMVVTVAVVRMIMIVTVRLGGLVSAAFGLERRVDQRDLGAQALQQRFDRRIAREPQPPLQYLHRHMAVAKMPGETRERGKIRGPNLDQRFGFGNDFD